MDGLGLEYMASAISLNVPVPEHKRLQTSCILVSFFYKCEIAELLCDFIG